MRSTGQLRHHQPLLPFLPRCCTSTYDIDKCCRFAAVAAQLGYSREHLTRCYRRAGLQRLARILLIPELRLRSALR